MLQFKVKEWEEVTGIERKWMKQIKERYEFIEEWMRKEKEELEQ